MAKRLRDRIALVTGAASGIGSAVTARLREEGAIVVACDQHPRGDEQCANVYWQMLDVVSEHDWDKVLAYVREEHGGLDILVNNAGIHLVANADETTRENWTRVMNVNVWGTFLGCRKAIPILCDRGGGAILNLSSFAAIRGVPRQVAYATSKGAIMAMTLALAADHVRDRIRINCVCPGATRTPIIESLAASNDDPSGFLADLEAKTPMGRMAEPEEVAAAVAYLVSDDASHTTGLALPVDGGRSSR